MSDSSLYHFIRASIGTSHPLLKLVFLSFGMLSIWLLTTLLGALIAIPVFRLSWQEIWELTNANFAWASPSFIKYFQAVQSVGFFLIPGLILPPVLFGDRPHETEKKYAPLINYALILVTIICSLPLVNYLVVWNAGLSLPESMAGLEESLHKFEDEATRLTTKMLGAQGIFQFIIVLFVAAVLPALGEELIFRRILQTILYRWIGNIHLAILGTGIIFSAFHMQFFGFIPRLVLGIYFGYLYYWSGNIRFAVWAHFLNNAIAITVLQLLTPENEGIHNFFGAGSETYSYALLIAILLTTISLYLFRKVNFSGQPQ